MEEAVRWNIKVSKETDQAVSEIKAKNAATDPDELQRIIDATVTQVRHSRG